MHRTAMAAAALWLAIGLGGCAIHPLPQDFAGVDTPDIVRQVRCEARGAIADNIRQWLDAPGRTAPERALGAQFSADPKQPAPFSEALFAGSDLAIIRKFAQSAIAYDFTFDMTEVNTLDASLDILGILRHTLGSAALSGGLDRTRENIRTFTITDTFEGLLTMADPAAYCRRYVAVHDVIYPITGTIGLGEMIHAFVVMSLFSNLDGAGHKGPPAMGDTITFTTRLAGALTPKVVLAPAFRGAQLADAALTAGVSRLDVHRVIIGLALPPGPDTAQHETSGAFITASGTAAETRAAQQISQIIYRFELGRAGAVAGLSP